MIRFDDAKHQSTEEYFDGNQFSIDAFNKKYTVREGETYVEAIWRVCQYVAQAEETPTLQKYWAERWFDEIYNDWWHPAGSIMQGAASGRKISLFNCFSRDTEFITSRGVKSFEDFADGDSVDVLTNYGGFKPATVRNFGQERLYRVTFGRNRMTKEVLCTLNHLWRTLRKDTIVVKTTADLKCGDDIPYIKRKWMEGLDGRYFCPLGFIHGLVFGDGTYHPDNDTCSIDLCDDSKDMAKYFQGFAWNIIPAGDNIRIQYLPNYMKNFPDFEHVNSEYILGFLAGWFAADGTVDKDTGSANLYSATIENLEIIKRVMEAVGIYGSEIRKMRDASPFDGNPDQKCWSLHLVHDTLFRNFFVKTRHLENYAVYVDGKVKDKGKANWKVISVEETTFVDDVWCVVEPETQNFTLAGGINTHNCTHVSLGANREDEEWDNLESIIRNGGYTVAKDAAYRQGLGMDFSRLRPANTTVQNSANFSTGSIHWMKFIDSLGRFVGQQGRIPAMLFSLSCSHPDVIDFVKVKADRTVIQNANISVQCTDAFYDAVDADADWELSFHIPEVKKGQKVYVDVHSTDMSCKYDEKKRKWYYTARKPRAAESVSKTVKARDLMELIAKYMLANGEPGVQNIDIARYWSNSDYVYDPKDEYDSRIIGTNACCLAADTKIMTNHGWFTIKEIYNLVNSGDKTLFAMSYNLETKSFEMKAITNAWQQRNDTTVELVVEENGKTYKVECSSDHKIMTRNRGYVPAASLTENDDIMIFS